MKIYVASSWRNDYQQPVVERLKNEGHEVYDFKNPGEGKRGFSWSEIDEKWQDWDNPQYLNALNHPIAKEGFANDFTGMEWADACVLVMPCGRSAHVEAGYIQGSGRPTIILLSNENVAEADLMYKMFDRVTNKLEDVVERLEELHDMSSEERALLDPKLAIAAKAAAWDALKEEIGDYYEDMDDNGNEIPAKKQGSLLDIGEAAAYALGYM